jgi:hypothetical protein
MEDTKERTVDENAVTLYEYTKELAKIKYESELRREDSLIQQGSQMQTAFAFTTAAFFTAYPTIIEYRGRISLNYLLWAAVTIVLALLLSLLFAALVQRRVLKETLMDIPEMENYIAEHYNELLNIDSQLKQWVVLIGKVQVNLAGINNRRVLYIRISMIFFFVALALIALWSIQGLIILFA